MIYIKILILDPSDLSSFGSGQIRKLLLTLLAIRSLKFKITLIINYKSAVIQLDLINTDNKALSMHMRRLFLLRSSRPRILSDFVTSLYIIFKYLLLRGLNSFDLVLLEHYNYGFTAPILRLLKPLVYDAHAVEYELATTIRSKIFISVQELMALKYSDLIIVLSKADALQFNYLYKIPLNKIMIIPLPMINKLPKLLGDFSTIQELKRKFKEKLTQKYGDDVINKPLIVFHGSLKYAPNKEAVDFIINNLAPKCAECIFIIMGPDPPYVGRSDNVIFTGFVKNVEEILLACDLAIIPIKRTTGVNIKVYDYIAYGLPIIATRPILRWFNVNMVKGTAVITTLNCFEKSLRQVLDTGYINTMWAGERKLKDYARDYALAILKALKIKVKQ